MEGAWTAQAEAPSGMWRSGPSCRDVTCRETLLPCYTSFIEPPEAGFLANATSHCSFLWTQLLFYGQWLTSAYVCLM